MGRDKPCQAPFPENDIPPPKKKIITLLCKIEIHQKTKTWSNLFISKERSTRLQFPLTVFRGKVGLQPFYKSIPLTQIRIQGAINVTLSNYLYRYGT